MANDVPLFASKLRARRRALGATQEEMAERLGVDRTTLWRWENGKAMPKSGEAIAAVKRTYDFSQEEMNRWYAGETPEREMRNSYAISGYNSMAEQGWSLEGLVGRVLEMDAEIIPGIDQADLGTSEQWVPIFLESPWSWRLLTCGTEVVGYWQYLCLKKAAFERIKAGHLRDGELTPEMIEFPVPLDSSRDYRMYVIMIGIVPAHQNPVSEAMMLRDFTSELARLAKEGVFFSEVSVVAFSAKSAYLCRELGMRSLGNCHYRTGNEIGEIFHIEGPDIATARMVRTDRALANRYSQRFT